MLRSHQGGPLTALRRPPDTHLACWQASLLLKNERVPQDSSKVQVLPAHATVESRYRPPVAQDHVVAPRIAASLCTVSHIRVRQETRQSSDSCEVPISLLSTNEEGCRCPSGDGQTSEITR